MGLPVFLCCSFAAEAPLAGVVKALRSEGRTVETVPGLEEEARAFGKVLDSNSDEGLYVVVQGLGIDPSVVRQLEGMFSARRGARHVLAVVTLSPSDPMELLPHIRRAMGGEEVRPPSPRKRSSNRWRVPTPTRDVDVDADAIARRLNAEMDNAEAALTRTSQDGLEQSEQDAPAVDVPLTESGRRGAEVPIGAEVAVVDLSAGWGSGRPRWLWPAVGATAVATVIAAVVALGGGTPPPEHTTRKMPVTASSVPRHEARNIRANKAGNARFIGRKYSRFSRKRDSSDSLGRISNRSLRQS